MRLTDLPEEYMKIEQIRLDHFRNYESLDLSLGGGTNLFYGDNAQGKTNILESVFLCGTTRSHRGARDKEMIRFGSDEAHIRMQFLKQFDADDGKESGDDGISYRIDMHLKKSRAKGIAINGMIIHRASELIGLGGFVFFSPEDLNIIKAGPAERRRFMNMELSQLRKVYVHAMEGYQKALDQRNRLLKDMFTYPDAEAMLDVWDEQLVSYGMRIIEERARFTEQLNEVIGGIHSRLTGHTEQLQVTYQPNIQAENFLEQLRRTRERDKRLKSTGTGPHKDDLLFLSNGTDLRRFGSQGQQRTCALSLKLSEIELMKRESGDTPVLLLDDVLSELDHNRQQFLLESIEHIQTLITCTGIEGFENGALPIDRRFHVVSGHVES